MLIGRADHRLVIKLCEHGSSQSKSLEKLSSGLRINRAGDDAAGLAISEKMRGQIKGLNQSVRNAQDGISLIQTAEGALNETHSILNRMRELAVQSSNDTNTNEDRVEIQKEMDQLATEITRISSDTEFNTQKLLNGSFDAKFHIGANKGQNMRLEVSDMSSKALGVEGVAGFKQEATATPITSLSLDNSDPAAPAVALAHTNGAAVATPNQLVASKLSSTAKVEGTDYSYALKNANGNVVALSEDGQEYTFLDNEGNKEDISGSTLVSATTIDFGTAKVTSGNVTVTTTASGSSNDTVDSISAIAEEGTVSITEGTLGAGKYTAAQVSGTLSLLDDSKNVVATSADGVTWTSAKDSSQDVFVAATAISAGDEINISGSGIDVSSQTAADAAIKTIDDAITAVSAERSKLGSVQNRLDHTINNLTTTSENLSAAESRIRDVDMAKEMMEFTKNNILNQASTAMLAQANQMPQGVLQLLG